MDTVGYSGIQRDTVDLLQNGYNYRIQIDTHRDTTVEYQSKGDTAVRYKSYTGTGGRRDTCTGAGEIQAS